MGIRELKNRLSEYIRMARRGEQVLVTDRGVVVAELRKPDPGAVDHRYPGLVELARQGTARLGPENRPDVYPSLEPVAAECDAAKLLDEERGER